MLERYMNKIELNDDWVLEEAPYRTTLAKYAFMLSRGKQYSIIEARNNNTFKYILNYDTAAVSTSDCTLITPRGKGGKSETLEGALLAIGVKKEDAEYTIQSICKSPFVK